MCEDWGMWTKGGVCAAEGCVWTRGSVYVTEGWRMWTWGGVDPRTVRNPNPKLRHRPGEWFGMVLVNGLAQGFPTSLDEHPV